MPKKSMFVSLFVASMRIRAKQTRLGRDFSAHLRPAVSVGARSATSQRFFPLLLLAALPAFSALATDAEKKVGNDAGEAAAKNYSDMDVFQRSMIEGGAKDQAKDPKTDISKDAIIANRRYLDLNNNGKMDAYENPELPAEARAEDLLGQMSLEEAAGCILQRLPAIPRLGIPLFNWRQEAIRGLISHTPVTVLPTGLGNAASFDPQLMEQAGSDMGDEIRAIVNRSLARDPKEGMKDGGLCAWNPIVDLGRDPRWGRLQESLGEDPCLAGKLGAAVCRGLQGYDPKYIKIIAEPKHFVANGTGFNRHSSSSNTDERNLREYYLPPFKDCVIEGKALGIMAAYNAVNGVPCPANEFLLKQVLRKEWGFQGVVISDCGAIYDIAASHKYAANEVEGISKALNAGCDIECGAVYEKFIQEALKQGLVSEQQIRQIARRVLPLIFRLGLMDPPEMVPYTRIPPSVIDSKAHRKVAMQLARESMTLLKNDGNLLPLNAQKVRSVALIGPYAAEVVVGMDVPTSSTLSTPIKAVADLLGIKTLVRSYGRVGTANFDECSSPQRRYDDDWAYVGGRPVSQALGWNGTEWLSYKNVDFTGLKKVTLGMQSIYGDFSVELRRDKPDGPLLGSLEIPLKQEQGRLFDIDVTNPAEGMHDLYLSFIPKKNGPMCQPFVMDLHRESASGPEIYSMSEPGQQPKLAYASGIVIPWTSTYGMPDGKKPRSMKGLKPGEMDENRMMLLQESSNPEKQFDEAIALAKSSEVAIVFAGFDERHSYEGEDRLDLNLPGRQAELIKAVAKVNPNTIVVLKVGGPVAGDWVKDVKAILCSWYVGQYEGQPIAETLFGENNPAGRSPLTWYNDISEVPDFLDYNIRAGRTYQYFKGKPLFAFGHGLSYTRFDYGEMKLSKSKLAPGQKVGVEVKVKNVGERAGDEVVQLYVKEEHPTVDRPLKQLAGFQRITLQPGEEKLVQLELPYDFLAFYDEASKTMKVNPGSFRVMVGASSEDIRQQASIEVPAKK